MRKPFDELTIIDDYMFYLVMQDMELCKTLLNMVLSNESCAITDIGLQKSFESGGYAKGIRLDIWAKDAAGTVYDIEMQAVNKKDIAKRMRYYQGAIDTHCLEKGSHYNELTDSYIIFMCPFDYIGKGLPVYTFKTLCLEDTAIQLADSTTKIIINSTAAGKAKQSGLQAFLRYMNGEAVDSPYIKKLEKRIQTLKRNNELRETYMNLMTLEHEARYEGLLAGRQEGLLAGRQEGLLAGRQEGLLAGRQEGLLAGRQEGLLAGRQEGLLAGRQQTKCETAAALKQMGIPIHQIMQATGLRKEEIDECEKVV